MSTWGDALALASAHVDGAVEALTVARDEAVTERDAALASEADARAAQAAACAGRDAMAGQLAAAGEAISSANAALVLVTADRDELAAQLASLTAERDALAAQLAERPATPRTAWGACPVMPGGESMTAAQGVVTRWGPSSAVRQFFGSLKQPNIPPGSAVVHASYNMTAVPTAALLAGDLDETIRAWARALPSVLGVRLVVEWLHEPDAKVSKGSISLADAVAGKKRWRALVETERPDVRTACTLTGWAADPRSGADLAPWADCGTVLGLDLDGIRPTALPYPDFSQETALARDLVTSLGYATWAVPEFGAPRISTDADGLHRAAWITACGVALAEAGAEYVCAYEYDSTVGYAMTTAAEVAAWRALKA